MSMPWNDQQLDCVVTLGAAYVKISIFIGAAFLIIYSLYIGRFPQGLTFGDSLMLIMVAGCAVAIFFSFIGGLIGLGIVLMAPVRWGGRILKKHVPWIGWTLRSPYLPLPSVSLLSVSFAFFGVVWIDVLVQYGNTAWWELLLLSISLFIFYSMYQSSGKQLLMRGSLSLWSPAPEPTLASRSISSEELGLIRKTAPFIIALITLILSGNSERLLEGAMKAAHIRSENSLIYIKSPYRDMIPTALNAMDVASTPDYSAFTGVVILFTGFGTSTAIQFVDKGVAHQLDVPNDHLIIVRNTTARRPISK